MALQFNEGAYGSAYQQGLENELRGRPNLNETVTQPFMQGLSTLVQAQDLAQKREQDKKLYELQLADAQRKQREIDFENTPIGQLLSSNQLSSQVAPSSLLDKVQMPIAQGEGGIPQQQPMSMIERFRQFQSGNKLAAPQMQTPQEPDLSAVGLPQEASRMTLRQAKTLGEARKLFAQPGEGDYSVIGTDQQGQPIFADKMGRVKVGQIPGGSSLMAKNGQQKAPQGFRWTQSGELEAIPGGPADIKQQLLQQKEDFQIKGLKDQADLVIGKVDQALSKVGLLTTGIGGSIMGKIPGTEATNLENDIDTIKAILGFSQLTEMRKASPTGGALGQVSDRELKLLTSARASLDQKQSAEQLRERLNEIKTHYQNWLNTMNGILPTETSNNQNVPGAGKPIVQRNKKTGQMRQSFDGGVTWQPM